MSDALILPFKISGMIAANTLCEVITHPFEVLKTLQQTSSSTSKSRTAILSEYYSQKGLASLYKGFSPAMMKTLQNSVLRYGLFELIKKQLSEPGTFSSNSLSPTLKTTLSACVASVLGSLLSSPWDLIKVRMITDKSGEYSSIKQSAMRILNQNGYKGLLRGTSLNVARSTVTNTIDLAIYDICKNYLKTKEGYDIKASLTASGISSLVSAIVSYPIDLIRTLHLNDSRQESKSGFGIQKLSSLVRRVVEQRGWKGMYSGFVPYTTRFLIYGPLFWNTFEIFSNFFAAVSTYSK